MKVGLWRRLQQAPLRSLLVIHKGSELSPPLTVQL